MGVLGTRGDAVALFHKKFGFALKQKLTDHNNGGASLELCRVGGALAEMAETLKRSGLELQQLGDCRLYRAHLVLEEVAEMFQALSKCDEVELADALGDLEYVTEGTAETYDIPLAHVFAEIHHSNMTKERAANDPRMKLKGPNYRPPNIAGAMERGRNGQ